MLFQVFSMELNPKIKKQEINIRYNGDYEIISKSYKDIINNKDSENTYLINNFIKHCPKRENIGYHICIKNKNIMK